MKDKQDSNNNNNKKTGFEVMTSAAQRVIKFVFLEGSSSGSHEIFQLICRIDSDRCSQVICIPLERP